MIRGIKDYVEELEARARDIKTKNLLLLEPTGGIRPCHTIFVPEDITPSSYSPRGKNKETKKGDYGAPRPAKLPPR